MPPQKASTVQAPVTTASGPSPDTGSHDGTSPPPPETTTVTAAAHGQVMIFAIAGAAGLVMLIVISVVFVVWRRRKNSNRANHVDPESDGDNQWTQGRAPESSTYASTRDSGLREDGDPVSDIELQPRFSVDLESIDTSADPPYESIDISQQIRTSDGSEVANNRSNLNKESEKHDSNSNAFNVKRSVDGEEGNDDYTRDDDDTRDTDDTPDSDTDIEHYNKGGEQYTLVRKQSSKTAVLMNYELAQSSNVINVANDSSDTKSEDSVSDEDGDGVYVAMGDVEDDLYVNNREVLAYDEEDDMYTNSVEVRRFQSVKEKQQEENYAPRRAASTGGTGAAKPPKPQPRLSKRKTIDPYDYLPGFSRDSGMEASSN